MKNCQPCRVMGVVCVLAIGVLSAPSMEECRAASIIAAPMLPPPPVTRMVNIDGRFVRVSLSVIRVIPGAPLPEGNQVTVTARVHLSIQDGAPLPEGLRATIGRFERPRAAARPFNARLTEFEVTSDEFELDIRGYQADITHKARNGQRLRATVRLVINGRIIPVPMGVVPVHTEPLP